MFGGTVLIAACLALFIRRTKIGAASVILVAYLFANFIAAGVRSATGEPVDPYDFAALAVGMAASFPIVFSDLIAGKPIDIVGDEK